jgi:hypothetical protein
MNLFEPNDKLIICSTNGQFNSDGTLPEKLEAAKAAWIDLFAKLNDF